MRSTLYRLHRWAALVVGVFVVVVGLTGSIIAFEDDLNRLLYPRLFTAEPAGHPLTVAAMLDAAAGAYPQQPIVNFSLPQGKGDTASFVVRGPRQVFMNPYNGAIVGDRDPVTVLTRIHQMHLRLLMGPTGASVVTSVAATAVFLLVSGVYLWWPVKRGTIRRGGGRRLAFDAHLALGIWSSGALLMLALTGIVAHFGDAIETWLHHSGGTTRVRRAAESLAPSGQDAITVDEAISRAHAALPDTVSSAVTAPAGPRGSYLISMRYPEDLTPGGRSWVNIDQYSGAVLSLQDARHAAMATRVIIVNRALHTGDIFGYYSKVVVALCGMLLVAQAVTGYYLWWTRRRLAVRARR